VTFDNTQHSVAYRWKADEPKFEMPIRVGSRGQWQVIRPTAQWKTMQSPLGKDEFQVATELYFVSVAKR
jgi:hypothetical protein